MGHPGAGLRREPLRRERPSARRAFGLLVLAASISLLASSCDWAGWRYDAAHSGSNGSEHGVTTANANNLVLRWRARTNGPVLSTAAIVGGFAYVGSEDGFLYAYDASGRGGCFGNTPRDCFAQWVGGTDGPIDSSPTVSNGVIYVGSGDGHLYAFPTNPDGSGCTSTLPMECPPSWAVSTGGPVVSSPTIVGSTIYVGSDDGILRAISTSGTVLWTATTGGPIRSSPAVAGGKVFVGSDDGKVYAYDAAGVTDCVPGGPATCSPLWVANTGGKVRSSPAVVGGTVFVGSDVGKLFALNAGTGAPAWFATTGGPVTASPAVTGGTVVAPSADGNIYAFTTAGAPLWSASTGGAIGGSPSIGGGLVYIASSDHHVTAYDLAGVVGCAGTPDVCGPLWSADAGSWLGASPTIANGAIFEGGSDGWMNAWQLPIAPIQPLAPTAVLVGGGSPGHVTVSWTAPVDDGGSPVLSYQLEVSTDDGVNWTGIGTINAPGLSTDHFCGASGVTCEYRVTATNAAGSSPASPPSTALTIPTPNSPPVFSLGTDPSVLDNAGAQTIDSFATVSSAGPFVGETVSFDVNNNNNGLFSAQPAIAPDGTLTFTPTLSFSGGTATVSVTAKNNGGTDYGGSDTSSPQTFSITVNHSNLPPSVGSPTFATRGNTGQTGDAPGVLAGTTDPEGGAVHICNAGSVDSAHGGSADIATDGSFTYHPPAGYTGTDTFPFTACDAQNLASDGSATVTVDGPVIWYVDPAAVNNGDGTDVYPFNTLGSASSASSPNDVIYLIRSGAGALSGITLQDGQQLIGAGAPLVRLPDNPDIAAGSAPTIKRLSVFGPIIQLGAGNTVAGLVVDGTGSTSGSPGISDASHADAAITGVTVQNTSGVGVSLTQVTGAVTLSHLTISSTTNNGLVIRNSTSGTLAVTADALTISGTSEAGNGVLVRTGGPGGSLNVAVSITNATFTGIDDGADGINAATVGTSSASLALTVTGSSFDNVFGGLPRGDNAISTTNDASGGSLQLDIENNALRNWTGDVIRVRGRGDSGQVGVDNYPGTPALIKNNTIGDPTDTTVVGSSAGHGISVVVEPHPGATASSALVKIDGNHIGGTFLGGIRAASRLGVGVPANLLLRVQITSNVIRIAGAPADRAFTMSTQGANTVCAAVTGNNATLLGAPPNTDALLQLSGPLNVVGVADFVGQTAAQFVDAHNTGAGTLVAGSPILAVPNTGVCGNP